MMFKEKTRFFYLIEGMKDESEPALEENFESYEPLTPEQLQELYDAFPKTNDYK